MPDLPVEGTASRVCDIGLRLALVRLIKANARRLNTEHGERRCLGVPSGPKRGGTRQGERGGTEQVAGKGYRGERSGMEPASGTNIGLVGPSTATRSGPGIAAPFHVKQGNAAQLSKFITAGYRRSHSGNAPS